VTSPPELALSAAVLADIDALKSIRAATLRADSVPSVRIRGLFGGAWAAQIFVMVSTETSAASPLSLRTDVAVRNVAPVR